MAQQATQTTESAIVLAAATSSVEQNDSNLERAFRGSLPAMLGLPKDKLLVLNVDIPSAVCLGLAVPERLQPWRARILDELPRFDIHALDHLEQYAKALMVAHCEYRLARKSPADIRALTEATRCRYQVLMNDARALASRGLIAPEHLEKFTGCRRRIDRVMALAALANVLKTAWPRIEGKTALTLTELQQADAQAMRLMSALAHQKKPLRDLAKITELRQRAFTVFANAYTQVRRAIQYLSEDAKEVERIIPSLYPRKRAAQKAHATDANSAAATEATSQPTAAPTPNHSQIAAPSSQLVVAPAVNHAPASSESTVAFPSTHLDVTSGPLGGTAPQRPSNREALPATATRRKSKRRRRPTKRERFLRSLGITARGQGSPHG